MHSHFRAILGSVGGVAILMIFILGFHLGGQDLLLVGTFSPLLGAFIGGTLVLVSVNIKFRQEENAEPWLERERLTWTLIGCGCIGWGIGESFWRHYVALGQNPFPSLADLGYSSFPPLVFTGLILQPITKSRASRRTFLLLDSLIAMGALLSIAWFLLLGSLAQTPAESVLGKFLGLYYAISDVALLSCIIFLLLRGSDPIYLARARRVSLIVVGLGISIFAASDFLFNVLQNLGLPVDGTWVDLGWPLGMMTIGVAAYLRRFLPRNTPKSVIQEQETRPTQQFSFGPAQAVPYLLLVLLFLVLAINVLSSDTTQQSIRPVLVVATMIVVALVLVRQILTLLDNAQLVRKQVAVLQELERVNQSIAERNATLEAGVTHLKDIQTRLANGDVRARASIMNGELWPLAIGLNLMADRMMRSERNQTDAQKVAKAVVDFSQALERRRKGIPFVLPASCLHVPEIHRLLLALDSKQAPATPQPVPHPVPPRPASSPFPPIPETPAASFHRQPSASPARRWQEAIKQRQDGSGAT